MDCPRPQCKARSDLEHRSSSKRSTGLARSQPQQQRGAFASQQPRRATICPAAAVEQGDDQFQTSRQQQRGTGVLSSRRSRSSSAELSLLNGQRGTGVLSSHRSRSSRAELSLLNSRVGVWSGPRVAEKQSKK
jgi:hypothetical protein